ncbi:MAG: efflux RND transporter periplasmic adaptor subunit [Muribaculaceae bacterium]|nr:efflux RND transporter periplasmic adaptor subunit [Muribaculaceae bacterium]
MNKFFIYSLAISAVALSACSGGDKKEADTKRAEETPVVKVETAEQKGVDQIGVYTATADPEIINNISSNMPLRIKQIFVDEGQRVAAGQKIAVLDDVNTFSYQTQVDNARANLHNVQLNYDRAVELFKIGGGTKQNVDAMEIQLVNARNALAQAERALRNARENTVLTSPISGVVVARNYDPGDMTGNLPIATVARVQPIKLVINVTEGELPYVHKGMPAAVKFDTYGDEEFKGTVATVMPTIDAQTRTFGVEITLPNSNNKVLPGMFGRVTLNLSSKERTVVPDKAVVKQQGSSNMYVYVLQPDNTVKYQQVELGRRLGSEYELISGVEAGSKVVVSGQNRLTNGSKVQVAK